MKQKPISEKVMSHRGFLESKDPFSLSVLEQRLIDHFNELDTADEKQALLISDKLSEWCLANRYDHRDCREAVKRLFVRGELTV